MVRQEKMFVTNIGEKFELRNVVDTSLKKINFDSSKSDITIIDFWNTTCGPCIKEMQQFPKLIQGKENKIRIVSISVNQYWLWKQTIAAHAGTFEFFANANDNWTQANLLTSEDQKLKNDLSWDRIEELQNKYNIVSFPAYIKQRRHYFITT